MDEITGVNNLKSRAAIAMRDTVHERMVALRNIALVASAAEMDDEAALIRKEAENYAQVERSLLALLNPNAAASAEDDRDTPGNPAMSYGAHKLAGEVMLADLSRRGMVDGLSLRLPGIVARPGVAAGHGSAFMSAVMHAASQDEPYAWPVSADAACW